MNFFLTDRILIRSVLKYQIKFKAFKQKCEDLKLKNSIEVFEFIRRDKDTISKFLERLTKLVSYELTKTYLDHMSNTIKPYIFERNENNMQSEAGEFCEVNPETVIMENDIVSFKTKMSYGIPDMYKRENDHEEPSKVEEPEIKEEEKIEIEDSSFEPFVKLYNENSVKEFCEDQRLVDMKLTFGRNDHFELFCKLVNFGKWPSSLKHISLVYDKNSNNQFVLGKSIKIKDLIDSFFSNYFPERLLKFTLASSSNVIFYDIKNLIEELNVIENVTEEIELNNF